MKITAQANANIALIKYWGKRNLKLNLPLNNSISLTLDKLNTTTTVEFSQKHKNDIFILNNKEENPQKISDHLNIVRKKAKINLHAKVESKNNFPTACGLASSSSGFAALSLAAAKAAKLNLSHQELSILARKGSGSASRSIFGGFSEWEKGQKSLDESSFAKQILAPQDWLDFRIIISVLTQKQKVTSSREGMLKTVLTSPMYKCWLNSINTDLKEMKKAITQKNFSLVGNIAELNCLKMHSTMLTSNPPLLYWLPQTVEIMHAIWNWRKQGLEAYFTIDAGAQVKIMCQKKDIQNVEIKLKSFDIIKTIVCKPGEDAKIINQHLF